MSIDCTCTAKECAASKCFDCQKYLAEPNFALKCLIRSIHGSHHVGDAQHTKLYQIFDEIDKLERGSNEHGTEIDIIIEECALICEYLAVDWLESVAKGRKNLAYEVEVLHDAADRLRKLKKEK